MSLGEWPTNFALDGFAGGFSEFVEFFELGSISFEGLGEASARLAKMMFKALSSCPKPVSRSYFATVQSNPQEVLSSPPEQEAAAPLADACR